MRPPNLRATRPTQVKEQRRRVMAECRMSAPWAQTPGGSVSSNNRPATLVSSARVASLPHPIIGCAARTTVIQIHQSTDADDRMPVVRTCIARRPPKTAQHFMGASEDPATPRPTNRALPYKPVAFTPNFPSYPSGHASLAGACFGVLRRVRAERGQGDPDRIDPDLVFVSDELNGLSIDHFANRPRPYLPRTFSSINNIIEDINRSRVYLGLHWNFDCVRGAASGARVAKIVYDSAYQRRPTNAYPEVSELRRRPLTTQCRSLASAVPNTAVARSR